MLGQRPLGERGLQPLPQRAVVLVAQPCGAMGGLEADKGEEGGWIGGVGEEVLGDDDVDDVVHCTRGVSTQRTVVGLSRTDKKTEVKAFVVKKHPNAHSQAR